MFFFKKKKIEYINQVKIVRSRRRLKTIVLRVRNKNIEILCPFSLSNSYLKTILNSKENWIKKKLENNSRNDKKKYFYDGCFINFKGEKIKIKIVESVNQNVLLDGKVLNVFFNNKNSKKNLIINWLKHQSEVFLKDRVKLISKRIAIKYSSMKIKSYRSRWGCCDHKGRIILNWKLIMCPKNVIDYVIIHELAHVRVPNHSRVFWNLVEEKDPDFKKNKNWLKQNGAELIEFG